MYGVRMHLRRGGHGPSPLPATRAGVLMLAMMALFLALTLAQLLALCVLMAHWARRRTPVPVSGLPSVKERE